MSRLLLEIYPEDAAGAGPLPPIIIAAGREPVPSPAPGSPPPIVLRLREGAYALHRSSNGTDQSLGLGQWHEADGWKLRITHALTADSGMTLMDNPSWAAPEIRISTQNGKGPEKQTRCILPVEEGSALVVGRSKEQADLMIEDDHISRRHLRFFVQNGRRYAEDLGSRWGTKLNGKALTDPVELKHGDELILGNSTIQYLCYWDILPEAGSSQAQSGAAQLSVTPGELTGQPESTAPEMPSVQKSSPAHKSSPARKTPEPAPAEKTPAPAPPAPAPAASDPEPLADWSAPAPARKPRPAWLGFDVLGAVLLVILLLAGIAYLAVKVLGQSQ